MICGTIFNNITGKIAQEAAMSIRDTKGNPGVWEGLAWGDLSGEERELWAVLGWREDMWDRNEAPPSTDKAWKDLTYQEQGAAMSLGFTEGIWDNFEDQ
jgi:hypothetical protein